MKAEQCFVLALWYSAEIQLSKDDEGITSIFIAEATLDRISFDGIGSLISFSASSFRFPPYQQPVPLVPELQLSCNFQPQCHCFETAKLNPKALWRGFILYLCHHFPVNFGISIIGEHWTQSLLEMEDVLCLLTKEYSFLFPFKLQEWN